MIPDNFRLIATSAAIVRAFGPAAAIWLGNAISSQDWSMSEHRDPWWWAGKSDIEERTGLSDEAQETARKRLREAGILHERRGILARGAKLASIWYWVDFQELAAFFDSREQRQSSTAPRGIPSPLCAAGDPDASFASSSTHLEPAAPAQPKVKKERKQRPVFQEPTLEEWTTFCRTSWPWMSKDSIEGSWNHYHLGAVDGQWFQKSGDPIRSWKQCANTSHGLFLQQNPAAKTNWQRLQQTAQRQQGPRPSASLEQDWMKDPKWIAHLEKCTAAGQNRMQAMLSFGRSE